MGKIRVPLFNQPRNFRDIDPDATAGATIGVNVFNQDGTLFVPAEATEGGTTIINGVAYTHVKVATATYSILASDDKKIFEFTFAGAVTVTLSGLIPFSSGFDIAAFCSGSGGQATFVGSNGMTITSSDSLKTRTQYSTVGLMVDEANQATMYGDLEPIAPALSVLARALNSIGAPAFLVAAANGQVLKRVADTLTFGLLTASEVEFVPAGTIAATNVQDAIEELDGDIVALEPRLFVTGTTYTFDIDITNADEGITDPYKFKTVYAAVLSILEILPLLPLNGDNTITMLLGNGDHYYTGFAYLFSYGADGGFDYGYLGLAGAAAAANCRFAITSKSTPSNITNGEWSTISSTANYAAEKVATFTANKALVESRFLCRIKPDPAVWQSYYFIFPKNTSVSGVALISDNVGWVYLTLPSVGVKPVAAVGCGYPYYDTTELITYHSPYNAQPYNAENAKIYFVNGSGEVHSLAPVGTVATFVIVNPDYPVLNMQAPYDTTPFYVWGTFVCIGSISGLGGNAWVTVLAKNTINLCMKSGSSLKNGDAFINFKDAYGHAGSKTLTLVSGSVAFPSAILRNDCAFPIRSGYNTPALATSFTAQGGFVISNYFLSERVPRHLYGTGSPNGVMIGNVGDTYSDLNGGSGGLYFKQSGVNTNTGWVAVGSGGGSGNSYNPSGW